MDHSGKWLLQRNPVTFIRYALNDIFVYKHFYRFINMKVCIFQVRFCFGILLSFCINSSPVVQFGAGYAVVSGFKTLIFNI